MCVCEVCVCVLLKCENVLLALFHFLCIPKLASTYLHVITVCVCV